MRIIRVLTLTVLLVAASFNSVLANSNEGSIGKSGTITHNVNVSPGGGGPVGS